MQIIKKLIESKYKVKWKSGVTIKEKIKAKG